MPSCLDKERKPMVPLKTLDVIFRRRYLKNTQFYFTNRKHAVIAKGPISKRVSPFNIPRTEKLISYVKYSDRKEKLIYKARLAQPLHLKDNLRLAATRDISRRLYLPEPPDDVRAVVEIHPEFYTVIEGRPLRAFDDIKVYVNNIRQYAMNRQQIGYRRDLIMKLEKNMVEESLQHDKIENEFKRHLANFQKFLTEDYKIACAKVARAEIVYVELVAKDSELLSYVSHLTILNNKIFKLDAIRNVLKTYRNYLMFVAPLSWRQHHDETLRGLIRSIQFESGIFETDNDLVEALDIDKMVELAKIELKDPQPATLYFTKPDQMMHLFRTMELQSREYLTQLSNTTAPFRMLQDRIKQLKLGTKIEFDYFQYYIDSINQEIARESSNQQHMEEKFFRILNELFYDCVASPTTLKLKICIEYVYAQIFGRSDAHDTLQEPMRVLEVLYEDYNLRLDALDFKVVNQARNDFFSQDLKMMRNAHNAQRELRAFREMTNAMNKAFLSPAHYVKPVLKKFITKKELRALALEEKKKIELMSGVRVRKQKKYKITPDEREGLLLFTDWCEGMNPAPFLKDYYEFVIPTFEWAPRKSITPD